MRVLRLVETVTGGVFFKNGVLKNFAKFIGKHLCQNLFFNNPAVLRPGALFKKKLWYRYFPVNFAKFLRTLFLQNTSWRLLLDKPTKRTLKMPGKGYLLLCDKPLKPS